MRIHILSNNIVRRRRLLAEHGLSLLIEFEGRTILMDTGQTDVYLSNAKSMGLNLDRVKYIILSHGHYDHCGGLKFFPFKEDGPKVYVKGSAFDKKIARNSDGKTFREIGIPWTIDEKSLRKDNFVYSKAQERIESDIYLLSEIQNNPSTEKLAKNILVERDGIEMIDTMEDEQILVLQDKEGLHIFLGCSHPGVISCISHVVNLFPNKKIRTLIGGMHLENIKEDRLLDIINMIDSFGIEKIIPLHCTGIEAIVGMKKYFQDRCEIFYTGDTINI